MLVMRGIALAAVLVGGGCAGVVLGQKPDQTRVVVGSLDNRAEGLPVMRTAPLYAQYAYLAAMAYDDSLYGLGTGHRAGLDVCADDEDCRGVPALVARVRSIWQAKPLLARINDCSPEVGSQARRDFDHGGKPGRCGVEQPGRHRVLDGLGIQIWARRRNPCSEMVVAFRGTDFNQSDDWLSNLRWVTRILPLHDQYEQVREHVDGLIDEAIRKLGCTPERIVAVGHSLGGGLAQHAAYAQLPRPGRPPIKRVYAFGPSFVTGSLDRAIQGERRTAALSGLRIDRVYEHGEILAYARLLQRQVYPPTACDPQIRLVRFNLLNGSVMTQHNLARLTRGFLRVSNGALAPLPMKEAGVLPDAPEAEGDSGRCKAPAASYASLAAQVETAYRDEGRLVVTVVQTR